MQLEIGNTYKTRFGGSVLIRGQDDDGRFFGDILDADGAHNRIASFSDHGQYVTGRQTGFDIVEKLVA
ncbi:MULTISPECIES: hypothetical protein [unclassified Polaromonas]|jgi:hypothetical protein|uniref:hypothetical protein n=1 Tax=unclassified Polaromonas TaxID=2638319 RepID=UPI000BD69C4C|nr:MULTISPECIES: hypothetical protein [unclassified Polaromonas]OYY34755.1 MAG: hypothetical protein B7Y60_15050 [Polaromonas sp. 35-63-35]OYZ19358.1 MAG: hypothetical protein B7Y28_12540 [Polaromonas sp. 16-63-31]OYZ77515.1 MAG: hypothetical protein B7Y09_16205 [Polaromonas sp. 24-63-21]OZA48501.1 MAG: hypothetical protein B7X88_18310 [Polaromonas sp. 17-63-33]OZA87250.1 MAG: hypothetical protein B7X65_13785 [Polaromonas sp. 39-63-25]